MHQVRQILRYHHYAYRTEKPIAIGSCAISGTMGVRHIPGICLWGLHSVGHALTCWESSST